MRKSKINVRELLCGAVVAGAAGAAPAHPSPVVDAQPRFDISPRLYMQFMEPRGTTSNWISEAKASADFRLGRCSRASALSS